MIKKLIIIILIVTIAGAESDLMPKNAKPGQCFTKSFYPPNYTKTVKVKTTKQVLIHDASIKYDVIPAKYSWYEKRIKVSDGKEKITTTPAVYKKVSEKVLVEPEVKVWRRGLERNSVKAFGSCVASASSSGMDIVDAKVGTCYYEYYKPEKYVTTTEKILLSEASEQIIVTPAKYRTYTKKLITDSTSIKLLPSKARYKKVKDKIVIDPAKTEWKKVTCQNRGCNQSEVVCLTERPVKYKHVTRRLLLQPAVKRQVSVSPKYEMVNVEELVTPATTKVVKVPAKYQQLEKRKKVEDSRYYWSERSNIDTQLRLLTQCNKICLTLSPAKYKMVVKNVVVTPAHSQKIVMPATYKTVKMKKILKEASFKKVVIPEEYITVVTERERTKGYSKWMPMICESNITPKMIKEVQRVLKSQGFYRGEIDGLWSLEVKSASRDYQKSKGLAITSKLSIELMISLGIY